MTYQKAIQNMDTGELEYVDLSPEEIAEIEAKLAASLAEAQAQVEIEKAATAEAEQASKTVAESPSDDDIKNAKTLDDLKALVLKQNAVIALLIKQVGLES